MPSQNDAEAVLRQTSRTFHPSIVGLPREIREAVMSSYLALRAVDEIEDHLNLAASTKVRLLRSISRHLKTPDTREGSSLLHQILAPHTSELAEVTLRLPEWLVLAPKGASHLVQIATAEMAERMAYWVDIEWLISSKRDLNRYTFCVAGAVGVLLSRLWTWYDGTPSRTRDAISYGRGLQAVNILRNRSEDLSRGVDFFPHAWTDEQFFRYARNNLRRGDAYVNCFPYGSAARKFCCGPQALAHATLDALERGESKLNRSAVLTILGTSNGEAPDLEEVILVNQDDEPTGTEEKLTAHRGGLLHRAFSVFIINSSGQLLLQRRASNKYHSRGLWSNTCCGHPRPNESVEQGSHRRLNEEMGINSDLQKLFDFIYRVELEDGMIEHEYDHVFVGHFNGVPKPNFSEVSAWQWIDPAELKVDLKAHPHKYTYWFRQSFQEFLKKLHPWEMGNVVAENHV